MEIKALDSEGRPLHRMQPQTGALPPIQVFWKEDGFALLKIFVRCGSTKGAWFYWEETETSEEPSAILEKASAFIGNKNYQGYLNYLEELFQWKWDSTSLPEAKAMSISLSDLGL